MERLQTGASYPAVNDSQVRAQEIPLPTPAEQHRIVGILDEAFAGLDAMRANAEASAKSSRALSERYVDAIFVTKGDKWTQDTIGNCFRLSSGDNLTSKAMIEGPYAVYGGNGIAGMHNNFNMSGDNVIVGRVGALCGNVRNIKEKIWLTDNAFKIVDKQYEFDNEFLTHLLNHKNLRRLARQSAQPVISNSSLRDVILDFPLSVTTQRKIGAFISEMASETDNLETVYSRKLAAIDELRKSLLHQAFSGNL